MASKSLEEQVKEELERLGMADASLDAFDEAFARIFCESSKPTDLDALYEEVGDEDDEEE